MISLAVFAFTGSLHCAGMCGAIAASTSRRGSFRDVLIYHASRLASYSFIGFVLGLVAATFLNQFPAIQALHSQYLGLILGGLMLVYAAFELAANFGWKRSPSPRWMQRLLRRLPLSEPLVLGIATALLPCGFLYAAFLQAAVLAHPVYSAAGMAVFAIATGPALGFGGALFLWLQRCAPRFAPWISALALAVAGVAVMMRSLPNAHHHHPTSSPTPAADHHHHP